MKTPPYVKPIVKGRSGKPATAQALPREVRIIGGAWKRSKLPVTDAPGLRPTPDRVRETLFNWLGQDLSGWRCLDAFAGSGALGFEAASRGADEVLMVERDRGAAQRLRDTAERLKADHGAHRAGRCLDGHGAAAGGQFRAGVCRPAL